MKQYIVVFIFLVITIGSLGQQNDSIREVPFQITFVPPMGTNVLYAGKTINWISINIIGGYAYGLTGVEFGSITNINSHFMHGVQFSGFANITNGKANGVQFSGFSNINNGNSEVIQFSGFANINNGITSGLQSAGFGNLARNIKGVQIAGFGNFARNVKGAQIAGFINVAKTISGLQLGVLNIADTVKNGIPIGVLSIVRNGYREFEIGLSEGLNSYASFKIGVTQFYNIFSIGIQYLSDRFRWGFGYGIGTHLTDSESFKVNLEAMSYHINENRNWTNAYNDIQQLKLTFARTLSDNISIFAGPTLNLMISDYLNPGQLRTGSCLAPYSIVNEWSNKTSLKGWAGFSAGIRIK